MELASCCAPPALIVQLRSDVFGIWIDFDDAFEVGIDLLSSWSAECTTVSKVVSKGRDLRTLRMRSRQNLTYSSEVRRSVEGSEKRRCSCSIVISLRSCPFRRPRWKTSGIVSADVLMVNSNCSIELSRISNNAGNEAYCLTRHGPVLIYLSDLPY